MKAFLKLCALCGFALFQTHCYRTHYLQSPQYIPLFSNKGETSSSGGLNFFGSAADANGNVAVAIHKNWFVAASGMVNKVSFSLTLNTVFSSFEQKLKTGELWLFCAQTWG
jgi:hypothetical protein